MSITRVTRWQTSDGELHISREWAETCEAKIEAAIKASDMLDSGSSVAECLRAINYPADIDAVLESVTKDTKLIISHWQCRDTPGYEPIRFLANGRIIVYGNAGAWNGSYGGKVKVSDLVCYATHTLAKAEEQGD